MGTQYPGERALVTLSTKSSNGTLTVQESVKPCSTLLRHAGRIIAPEHLESVLTWIQHIIGVQLFPETSLQNLSAGQKRAEPQFELPLKTSLTIHDLFEACENFSWWRPQPPSKDYGINGHLIGFIDLVLRPTNDST